MNNSDHKKITFHILTLVFLGFAAQETSIFHFESLDSIVLGIIIFVTIFASTYLVLPYLILLYFSSSIRINLGINIISEIQILALLVYFLKADKTHLKLFFNNSRKLIFFFLLYFILDLISFIRTSDFAISNLVPLFGSYIRIFTLFIFSLSIFSKANNIKSKTFLFYLLLIPASIVGMAMNYFVNSFGGVSIPELMNLRNTLLYDPNYGTIGNGFMIAIIILIFFSIQLKIFQKLILIILGGIAVSGILYAGSRTALYAASGGILLTYLLHLKKAYRYIFIVIILVVTVLNYLPYSLFERITEFKIGFEKARQMTMTNALYTFYEFPVFGAGSQFYLKPLIMTDRLGAHNTFLEYAAKGGIIFLLIFISILSMVLKRIIEIKKVYPLLFKVYLILFITFLIAANGLSFGVNDIAVIILVVLFGVITSYRYHLENLKKHRIRPTNFSYKNANINI